MKVVAPVEAGGDSWEVLVWYFLVVLRRIFWTLPRKAGEEAIFSI